MLSFLCRALKRTRFHIGAYQLCKKLLYPFTDTGQGMVFSDEEVAQAYHTLHTFHPDVATSALTRNQIREQVDLQIIIPVYQVEAFVEACIESVLHQQTRYSYLMTIVNDGSPDRSRELLRKYEHLPQIEIIDQENRGFSGARNRALEVIKGRYVTFLDSDDRLPEGAIEHLMQAADKQDADVVQGSYRTITSKGTVCEEYILPASSQAYADKQLLGYTWGKLFRASLFARIHFPEHYWFEDSICTYLLFPQARVSVCIEHIIYEYRIHDAGITQRSRGKRKTLDTLYITESLLKDADRRGYTRTDAFYEQQFDEFRINQSRIRSLKNPAIDKATFIIQAHLLEKYFPNRQVKTSSYVILQLEEALRRHRYIQYKLINYLL